MAVFPSSLGGVNYSPASYDPKTNYVFNGAAETAAIDVQVKLTPTQKKRKRVLGDVFLGLANGNFGQLLPGWRDHGSISAIDINTGRRVWKFKTPEPERGGVTTTASGLGFAGGGDGVFRAFDLKTGKVLWTFQTGHQIASGASIYSVDGKQYIAITSGGTPTSSGGGTASELQVFSLGASTKESPPPVLPLVVAHPQSAAVPPVQRTPQTVHRAARTAAVSAGQRVLTQGGLVVQPWDANSSNVRNVTGRVVLGGAPVAGARVTVDSYAIPQPTAADGSFRYDVDATVARRHPARVTGLARATVRGKPLTDAQRTALLSASGGFSVGYRIDDLRAKVAENGNVLVTGRLRDSRGNAPPTVVLYTYQLKGTITDAAGKPVADAVVITRTQDRDFWTFSSPTDANGHYTSFFAASDETAADPVPLSVGVASGGTSYGGVTGTIANFDRLHSATMNISLASGGRYTIEKPTSYAGAIYEGLVVGASGPGGVIKPLSERWPDAAGRFQIVLPASVRGKTLNFWENQRQFYSQFPARPGGPVDLSAWPSQLGPAAPRGLAFLKVPSS